MLQQLDAAPSPKPTSERAPDHEVLYIGRAASVEEQIASSVNIPFVGIQVGGIRSKAALTQARNVVQMMQAARVAENAIAHFKPNGVLATGGYVSAPVLWAAWRKHVPIVIELPDLEPGWAIRATWRLSKQVAVSFDEVRKHFSPGRATVTGYPVRREFFQATREQGRAHFGLGTDAPAVTVFGGSQGAHVLNEAVRTGLRELLSVTQILHVCGMNDRMQLEADRARLEPKLAERYHVFDYLNEDMPLALAAADVIVARAGAATLGEFPAVGVPSILVPGLFAQGHQEKNADWLVSRGAALKLHETRLATEFVPTLLGLVQDETRLKRMRDAVNTLARPDAPRRIAELVMAYAR